MAEQTTLTLYHAPSTRSVRVRWLLEEMGLDYTLIPVQFDKRPAGDEAYAQIHPLRKVPALTDGDERIFESIAIMQYVMGRYGPTELDVKPDESDYGTYLQWLHFGEAGMMLPVSLLLAHTVLLPEKARSESIAKSAKQDVDKLLDMLGSTGLERREYLAADRFTAADVSVGYMLYLLKLIGQLGDAPDTVKAYFRHLTGRAGWKTASARD